MKLIVVTTEDFFDGEAAALNHLFENGMSLLHLRKPNASKVQTARLIQQIHQEFHPCIVIHDHFSLTSGFQLKGIHLNRRNPAPPSNFHGTKSASCHTIEELTGNVGAGMVGAGIVGAGIVGAGIVGAGIVGAGLKPAPTSTMDYFFLSPIFDSISKENYTARFPEPLLHAAKENGIINEKVIALGGINRHNIHKVKMYGFGGAAVLGGLWNDFPTEQNTTSLLTCFKEIQHAAEE